MGTFARNTVPIALALVLAAALVAVATTTTQVPGTSAVVRIWADLIRDVDTVGLAITRVSPEEEQRIGDAIAQNVESGSLTKDSALADYVAAVGNAIMDPAGPQPFRYTFKVIASGQVNAFAIPGGHVYVTTGLLAELQSEAELAFIIGHEISHIALRHCIGNLQYELVARRIAGDNIAAIVGLAHRLVALSYDSEQETDADLNGMLFAVKAGYDPNAALGALYLLARLEAGNQRPLPRTAAGEIVGGLGRIAGDLFRDHPEAVQRIADAEAMMARNASKWRGQRFYVGKRNFDEKSPRSVVTYDDEWVVFEKPVRAPIPTDRGETGGNVEVTPGTTPADNRSEIRQEEASVYNQRGGAHRREGELDLAIADYSKAIEIDPKYASAYNNLAWLLATASDPQYLDGLRAIELAETATRLVPDRPAYMDTLAAAYAEAGQYAEAIREQQRAIEILVQQGADTTGYQARLDLYLKNKPYREQPP